MKQTLKVKYLVEGLKPIGYSREGDAAIELRASGRWIKDLDLGKEEHEAEEYEIRSGERILVKTGVQVEIPKGHWGNIRDRSGVALKQGIHTVAGVIDETYRGEIGIVMINSSKLSQVIKKNERIAQMIITPYSSVDIVDSEEFSESVRGDKGFGSSGKD